MSPESRIAFRVLGTVDLRGPAGHELLSVLSRPKQLALLAYLAVSSPGTVHRRDKLAALLWPDLPQDRARAALRKSLHYLRQSLGTETLENRGDEEIGIAADAVRCDAAEFQALVAEGRAADALALYEGPLLDGFFLTSCPELEEWIERTRAVLHQQARETAWSLSDAEWEAGNRVGGLSWAERAVALDPLDERGVRRLIERKAALGDRSGALQLYQRFSERLERELDLAPSPATIELIDGIVGTGSEAPRDERNLEAGSPTPREPGGGVQVPPQEAGATGTPARRTSGSGAGGSLPDLGSDLEVIRVLGEGSVATVYLAREQDLSRLVAVKRLHPRLAADPTVRLRFDREARAAAQISHPNVATIYRIGSPDLGSPFLVMEYIEGRTLAEALAAEGSFGAVKGLGVVRQVAAALAAVHEKHIVHRDVRPSNILREDATGRVVLSDFGLARTLESALPTHAITKQGELLGDPLYVSPEQFTGSDVTEAADIFSLGVVSYELLTGAGPFGTSPGRMTMTRRLQQEPTPLSSLLPGIAPEVAAVVERCLAPNPKHRPTAAHVRDQLEQE